MGFRDTTKAGLGKGEGSSKRSGRATIPGRAAGPRIGPRSQVEIHKRPRRLVASCAQLQQCVAWPCGTLPREAAGPYRCAAWAGVQLLLPFDWVFLVLSTLLPPRLGMHMASLGEDLLPPPLNPVLDLSMTRSSPPSVLQLAGKQDGGKRSKRK